MTMNIVARRRLWYGISGVFVAASIVVLAVWKLNIGIDFTGGTLVELSFREDVPTVEGVRGAFERVGAERVVVQTAGERGVIVRTAPMTEEVRQQMVAAFRDTATVERYELIGPTVGRELARKTMIAIVLSLVLIALYVALAFRKAARDVSVWMFAGVSLIVMVHDVLIPVGVFAVLGRFMGVEVGAPFIAAALTILGYSINDKIVVLDRVRENVVRSHGGSFAELVNRSVVDTLARSINTTVTVFLALLAVFIVGGATLRPFALALLIGIGVSAYSSIFIAAPLLVTWKERGE
ncbi:MAG: protein translocase subunit SecF [bacterium]|nr:protein translocase subunit SecF [bacterium]